MFRQFLPLAVLGALAMSGVSAQTPAPPPAEIGVQAYPLKPGEEFGKGAIRPADMPSVKAPKVKSNDAYPRYSPRAMAAGIQGAVTVEAVVGADGKISEARVSKTRFRTREGTAGPADAVQDLMDAALKAARSWTFDPGTLDGLPVAVLVDIEMAFRLQ